MVIFGACGDLTKRLVIPALYNLSRTKVLPEKFALIGVARTEGTSESWRDHLYDMLKSFVGNRRCGIRCRPHRRGCVEAACGENVVCPGRSDQARTVRERFAVRLDEAEKTHGTEGNVIFYLAVADRFFGTVVEQLGKAKLTDQNEDQNGKHQILAPRGDREAVRP